MDAKSITIRNIPSVVHRELTARAARQGRSLQEFLAIELERLASKPSPEDLVERIRIRTEAAGSRISAAEILGHLEADRK